MPRRCVALFALSTLVLQEALAASCNYDIEVTNDWKNIQSPGFPTKFPPQTQCYWRLMAPEGYRIKLQFLRFSLVAPTQDGICNWQWLQIIDGDAGSYDQDGGHRVCGKQSPGTIVSSGRVLKLSLQSNTGSASQTYESFQASYAQTHDNPRIPEQAQTNVGGTKQDRPGPTRKTLGSVLERNKPKRPSTPKPMSQNERMELYNKYRNQGIDPNEIDISPYGEDNRMIRTRSTTPTTATTLLDDWAPPPKRTPTLSSEMRTVVIVVATIVVAFIVILIVKKFDLIQKYKKWKKKKSADDEMDMDSGFESHCKGVYVEDETVKHRIKKESLKSAGGKHQCRHQHRHHRHRYPEDQKIKRDDGKSQPPFSIKRTISKKTGVRSHPQHHLHHCRKKHKHKHRHSGHKSEKEQQLSDQPPPRDQKVQHLPEDDKDCVRQISAKDERVVNDAPKRRHHSNHQRSYVKTTYMNRAFDSEEDVENGSYHFKHSPPSREDKQSSEYQRHHRQQRSHKRHHLHHKRRSKNRYESSDSDSGI
ncbi:uncharacterized protein LOC143447081 [Clavelina lepadiformis]|uniref:uncharacterized protein LOC143447081 n=1 Tax=Clavelina lepadiformis TaxID=159417 RepID=UPI004041C268